MAGPCRKAVGCFPSMPVKCMDCGEFRLDESGSPIFDSVAVEYTAACGTPVELFSMDRKKTIVDALYGEAVSYAWLGPFKLFAYVPKPAVGPEIRQEGLKESFPLEVVIPRRGLEEAGAPVPAVNDVIGFWQLPYWQGAGTLPAATSIARYYFDVTTVDEDGFLFDTGMFTHFRLTVARNTSFTPERKVFNR